MAGYMTKGNGLVCEGQFMGAENDMIENGMFVDLMIHEEEEVPRFMSSVALPVDTNFLIKQKIVIAGKNYVRVEALSVQKKDGPYVVEQVDTAPLDIGRDFPFIGFTPSLLKRNIMIKARKIVVGDEFLCPIEQESAELLRVGDKATYGGSYLFSKAE